MKRIGPRITLLRMEAGLSLSKLAEKSGISKSLLHRIEKKDDSNPELDTLRKVARGLGVTVGFLLENEAVRSVRSLPEKMPAWLDSLVTKLRSEGKEPDLDLLEALYVLQNRRGELAKDEDWHYIYTTLDRGIPKK